MSYDTNPYYKPEAMGLRIVETLDAGGGYDFDMVVVWEDLNTGTLYWAADSGCSCPSPFESYDRSTITELTSGGWDDLATAATACYGASDADRGEFLGKVSALLAAYEDRKRLNLPGVDPRLGELRSQLAATEANAAKYLIEKRVAEKELATLKNGVVQQGELMRVLQDIYKQLDVWFGPEKPTVFKIMSPRTANVGKQ